MNIHKPEYDVGVIVGRFQVHELHPGHRELLDYIHDNHDTMIVVIGNTTLASRDNPLPYNARRVMIQQMYPSAIIVPLNDMRSDKLWSDTLDTKIKDVIRPTETVCLYGSRDGFTETYSGGFPTQELVASEPFWSGTEVRSKLINKVQTSADFRAGIIYASGGDWPRVIPTVDAVIFESSERKAVYMVRKNGESQFRFPGGYAEGGMSYKAAVRKEIREEVGSMSVESLDYLGDTGIDDWRLGSRTTIHTTVFVGTKTFGKTGDFTDTNEIAEVRPFTVTNLLLGYKKSVVPEHHVIVEMLKDHLEKESKK